MIFIKNIKTNDIGGKLSTNEFSDKFFRIFDDADMTNIIRFTISSNKFFNILAVAPQII